MKTLVSLLLAAGVISAVARVGEKVGSLESRYGERYAIGADEYDSAGMLYGFDKEGKTRLRARGFQLFAVVDADEACQELIYEKQYGVPLSKEEVQGILISNCLGMSWKPVEGNVSGSLFQRTDGVIALISSPNRLEIMTAERASRRNIRVKG